MTHRIALFFLALALGGNAAAADADEAPHRAVYVGGNETISQPVQGPLIVLGGNVTVAAPVSGHAQLVGGKVTIAQGAVISGDVSAAGGDVTVDGSIAGHLRAAGGHIRINGSVTGDATVAAGTLELGPSARIQGKLDFRGDELRQDPAAQVAGGVEREVPRMHWGHSRSAGERFAMGWFWTVGLMVLAGIIAALLPGVSNRMARELREHPGTTLISGFLAFTAIPIAGVLLMLTIIGIPIALLGLMAYGVLLFMGYAWVAVIAGGMMLDRVKPEVAAIAAWRVGAAVLAMLVIALIARVPYIGGWAHLAALIVGIGMIAAVAFRPRPQEALPA